ncbi:MAG: YkvI family membrane protein [Longimicrobiales bacterium]
METLKRYLLPGFVFQSVVIAGGYGTGRELAEFFLSRGPLGGLFAMGVATLIWSAVSMASYEFARVYQVFDYRAFFKRLLGPGWVLYEISYIGLLMIVLAVIAAASGSILEETFGLPYLVGVIGITVLVGLLVVGGNDLIERVFTGWSAVLYLVYIAFFVWSMSRFGPEIRSAFAAGTIEGSWIQGGIAYAGYNLGVIPAVLFTLRHHKNRKETLVAGFLTGPIAMAPALLFFLAMAGEYPGILERAVPANHMLELLGSRGFQIAFQVMLFGTLVETGTGLIHAVNERLAGALAQKGQALSTRLRMTTATGLLVLAALIAQFGLIALIAKGYNSLTWAFVFVFIIPILTWGLVLIARAGNEGTPVA